MTWFHEHNRVLGANTQMRERHGPRSKFACCMGIFLTLRLRGFFLFNKAIVTNETVSLTGEAG